MGELMLSANIASELRKLWESWCDYRDIMAGSRRYFSYDEQQDVLNEFFAVRSQVLLHLEHREEQLALDVIRKHVRKLDEKAAALLAA